MKKLSLEPLDASHDGVAFAPTSCPGLSCHLPSVACVTCPHSEDYEVRVAGLESIAAAKKIFRELNKQGVGLSSTDTAAASAAALADEASAEENQSAFHSDFGDDTPYEDLCGTYWVPMSHGAKASASVRTSGRIRF